MEAAKDVAREEIAFMAGLCAEHDPNTLLAVSRELTEAGVREQFRHIAVADADIGIVAVHGTLD